MKIIEKIRKILGTEDQMKVPRTVQQVIPIKRVYEDGIFQVGMNKYSKTFKFSDINYITADDKTQKALFVSYQEMLNLLDDKCEYKTTIINRKFNRLDFENKIKMDVKNDELTKYRKELNEILSKNLVESQGVIQEKFITITVDKRNIDEARNFFTRISTAIKNSFSKLNSDFAPLSLYERLRLFYNFYNVGDEETYNFDLKSAMQKGHSFKDYICPDVFEFKRNYFRMGDRFGRVLFIKEVSTFLKDDIITELTSLNKNMMLSIDFKPMPMEEALKIVERKILGVESNIAKWQKSQNENNNFSAQLPFELRKQREECNEMLNDLMSRNQRMFLGTVILVHTAETMEELDNDTETLITSANKYMCQLKILKYQQMDGLNTTMPSGRKYISMKRTLTTESLSTFMPFRVQELQDPHGIYYGQNMISKNMILLDKHELQNGNSFILGVSGSGKSFSAKQEITQLILKNDDIDVIILDPESEYKTLVQNLGGEVIKISATSKNHINALDVNKNYDEEDPIKTKAEFLLSLCELIMQKKSEFDYKTVIDRCARKIYKEYKANNYQGIAPTLEDFRNELLKQDEKGAKDIALAIELFTKGSFNTFAKQTNVEINNRLVCFDTLELGEQLKPVAMFVILDNIYNRISRNRKKGRKTYIYVDEIYLLFQYPNTIAFMSQLWKRIRKYGGCATGISQNVEEILLNDKAKTMIANSEVLIVLNQSPTDRDRLIEKLKFTENEMSYITNAEAGTGIIKVKNSKIPFSNQFPKDSQLYKLMTTKLTEVV